MTYFAGLELYLNQWIASTKRISYTSYLDRKGTDDYNTG